MSRSAIFRPVLGAMVALAATAALSTSPAVAHDPSAGVSTSSTAGGAGSTAGAGERREAYAVPARATLTLTGHGYGHGHGMSQYGAEGAARQGLTAEQIVAFYYPGTVMSTYAGKVRVAVSADSSDDVVVLPRKNLAVRDLGTGAKAVVPAGPTRFRLVASGAGTRLEGLSGEGGAGGWRSLAAYAGEAEFTGRGAKSLVTPSGVRSYRGSLRSAAPSAGSAARDTVNVLPMDKYLRGVVPREIPTSWSPEALRAQAIAARTYAAHGMIEPGAAHWDLCDTTSCQVYGGASDESATTDAAIKSTPGMILTDPATGGPAFTQFSASSGGFTAAGSKPYLAAVADPYDGWEGNPVHTWTKALGDRAIEAAYPRIGNLREVVVTGRDGNGEWGGRITSVDFVGSRGRASATGDDVRARFGLRSTFFTFTVAGR